MKVEMAVLGSLSLIVLKATLNLNKNHTGRQAGRQAGKEGQGRAATYMYAGSAWNQSCQPVAVGRVLKRAGPGSGG